MLILTLLSSVLELLSITGIIYFINIISKDQIIVPSNFVDKILTDLSIFFWTRSYLFCWNNNYCFINIK